jgi:hypothetical protein
MSRCISWLDFSSVIAPENAALIVSTAPLRVVGGGVLVPGADRLHGEPLKVHGIWRPGFLAITVVAVMQLFAGAPLAEHEGLVATTHRLPPSIEEAAGPLNLYLLAHIGACNATDAAGRART